MLRRALRLYDWGPVLLAGLFVVAILLSGGLLDDLYANADATSALVIAELLPKAGADAAITLGDYAWYEPLWLFRATAWLPEHRTIWVLLPFLAWVATAALVYAAVLQATGSRRAAAIGAALVVCAGTGLRGALWTPNTHGLAVPHLLLLAVWLAWGARQPDRFAGVRGIGIAVVLGLVSALGATDTLLLLYGVAPLLLAAGALAIARSQWVALRAAVIVAGITVIGGKLLTDMGRDAGIVTTMRQFTFVQVDGVLGHLGLLPAAVSQIVTRSVFAGPITGRSVLTMAGGLLGLVVAVIVVRYAVPAALRAVFPDGPAVPPAGVARFIDRARGTESDAAFGPADAATKRSADDGDNDAWLAGLTFFTSVILASLGAWLFTSAPVDIFSGRYLVAAWIAVCVLLLALAFRNGSAWLATGVAIVLCGTSLVQFQYNPALREANQPTTQHAAELEQFAKEHGVTRGYSSYWVGAPITWYSDFALQLSPVFGCQGGEPGKNCKFYLHTISSWYTPGKGKTMLVIDPQTGPPVNVDPDYGAPLATRQVGPFTAHVFDHDIARELGG